MKLTPTQLEWMRHSINLTEAAVNIPLAVRARIYPDTPLHVHQHRLNMKRAALAALQSGAPMNDEQRRYADFLLAFADAHERFYRHGTMAQFYEAMARARAALWGDSALGRAA
jgi:hypothetical protein